MGVKRLRAWPCPSGAAKNEQKRGGGRGWASFRVVPESCVK